MKAIVNEYIVADLSTCKEVKENVVIQTKWPQLVGRVFVFGKSIYQEEQRKAFLANIGNR